MHLGLVINNTVYGGSTPTAPVGISIDPILPGSMNNSLSDMDSCITATTQTEGAYIDYNNFHACTTARTNVAAGANDTIADPGYTDETGTPPDFSPTSGIVETGRNIELGVN
jgi:hypothetical protein